MSQKKPASTSTFIDFVHGETFSGFLLVTAAAIAFAWANSPYAASYQALLATPIDLGVGGWRLEKNLLHFVNDFLMAVFFLMVGLEIKREMVEGELSTPSARMLPAAAALGGMVVPALIYAIFNAGGEGAHGWGIPMATDIAFTLGALALLGSRVPLALKVFLTALAIVDDLGAVLVIALFYTADLSFANLSISLAFCAAAGIYGWRKGRIRLIYLGLGLLAWYFMLKSGVHATVAGVLIAFTVPTSRLLPIADLRAKLQSKFGAKGSGAIDGDQDVRHVRSLMARTESPLHELEADLHPWVALLIVPVFAFLNAGFSLGAIELTAPVALGAFFGLLIGKPLGILGASWLVIKAGWAKLPDGSDWRAMLGAGTLAGIGFTMSLFVSALAFGKDGALLDSEAKLGIFAASILSAVVGLIVLGRVLPKTKA